VRVWITIYLWIFKYFFKIQNNFRFCDIGRIFVGRVKRDLLDRFFCVTPAQWCSWDDEILVYIVSFYVGYDNEPNQTYSRMTDSRVWRTRSIPRQMQLLITKRPYSLFIDCRIYRTSTAYCTNDWTEFQELPTVIGRHLFTSKSNEALNRVLLFPDTFLWDFS